MGLDKQPTPDKFQRALDLTSAFKSEGILAEKEALIRALKEQRSSHETFLVKRQAIRTTELTDAQD